MVYKNEEQTLLSNISDIDPWIYYLIFIKLNKDHFSCGEIVYDLIKRLSKKYKLTLDKRGLNEKATLQIAITDSHATIVSNGIDIVYSEKPEELKGYKYFYSLISQDFKFELNDHVLKHTPKISKYIPNGPCPSYEIQDGDSCNKIGGQFGITEKQIEAFNSKSSSFKGTWGFKGCTPLQRGIICVNKGRDLLEVEFVDLFKLQESHWLSYFVTSCLNLGQTLADVDLEETLKFARKASIQMTSTQKVLS
ncbi:hypothetical protein CONCODRAFT_9032 [Conidiobolus coronatus NRRL 28638]|uniref:LysM domain-containing protein n=1 Tax=Conidiobolus coronatus (strain ATCC 28846 / CBS 209.66 / NRRL 28638) TaxID=796925 RepID=A0A137P0V4_CONC2|nr:hypothetical protein CONCODRAFT_9032 [Conidiobolus coronatus NRRL 28638]|eukprot:KXN68700.1 hypothetical protein CONCODRAFT_9032 [Conidiobolus coronatus NRRL 28638]